MGGCLNVQIYFISVCKDEVFMMLALATMPLGVYLISY